jgi:hypothetical protein
VYLADGGLGMVRVCIEVECGEAGPTTLAVRAENILRALEIAGEENPGCALNVVFPLDPDTFFVRDATEGVEVEAAEIAA